MESYHIRGGRTLSGKLQVSGAKNAALPILAASVMTKGENIICRCPDITDVGSMVKILCALGCRVNRSGSTLSVNADFMSGCKIPEKMMKEMRSSVFLAGSLLTRCGEAVISNPGGCDIGSRPIDIHIDGLTALGAHVHRTEENIVIRAGRLRGSDITLSYPSVGATENLMLAAIGAEGTTVIRNSAREPEIADLQNYINTCGGRIRGAGSGIITIKGKTPLTGCAYGILADRIEAGTYLLMALGTGGEIVLEGIEAVMIEPLIDLLKCAGYAVRCESNFIWAKALGGEKLRCHVCTQPYPGFPTDLQPQLTTFLARNGEGSIIKENIFEKRFEYIKELKKMGADIEIFEKQVIIRSNKMLCGAHVEAKDLRGGAALVIAGVMAQGDTIIDNTKYIKRGYSSLNEKIRILGGEIMEHEA